MEGKETVLRAHLQLFETLSDGEVVMRILDGDHALYELIMRRYNRRLFRLAYGILSNHLLAQDAVQEAYVNVFLHLNQFRGPDGFGAWLMKITSRAAIRLARKESGLHTVNVQIDNVDLVAEKAAEPEHATINDEIVRLLEEAVDSLPRDFRVVLMLREFEGMNTDETARVLNLNPSTVKTRLHRAKGILRARFKYRLDEISPYAYPFAGTRCDAIVQKVFIRLKHLNNQARPEGKS
ncbi:MAG: RNA polymerase sigma factor [Candidatus Thiodiazotropha sp. (ex Myrtea sp. 'scaly one' KF741663)]|nr:RNA polymerase sigma factor [Candidatus Thiodiazotropha sp. (ex Myrtea sp. 'scaly one' KF741663)]